MPRNQPSQQSKKKAPRTRNKRPVASESSEDDLAATKSSRRAKKRTKVTEVPEEVNDEPESTELENVDSGEETGNEDKSDNEVRGLQNHG
jgi:hypothetical protein